MNDITETAQVILALLTNFSTISPSMSIGFSAVAIPILHKDLNNQQIAWFASVASLATPFGCLFSGPMADHYGRRSAILLVNAVCFLGWAIIAFACYSEGNKFNLLLCGRFLTGLSTGLSSSPATIYMSEVSSPALRSVFTIWATIFFSIGVLVVYILGLIWKENLVNISIMAAALPCIGIIFTTTLIPESPAWLLEKKKIEEARTNMYEIYGTTKYSPLVEAEIATYLINTSQKTRSIEKSVLQRILSKIRYLLQPYNLKPLMLVLMFFFFQQMSGCVVILFYAIDIVQNAGITFDSYTTIAIIAVVRIIATIISSAASKSFGRRPLSMISGIFMGTCLLGLVGYLYLKDYGVVDLENTKLVPFILIILYFSATCIGFLPFPFALSAEMFPTKVKGLVSGLSSGVGYFFNFLAVKMYPPMLEQFGSKGVFGFYGIIALFGTIFLAVFLPETRGKSVKEMQIYFGKTEEEEHEKHTLVPMTVK